MHDVVRHRRAVDDFGRRASLPPPAATSTADVVIGTKPGGVDCLLLLFPRQKNARCAVQYAGMVRALADRASWSITARQETVNCPEPHGARSRMVGLGGLELPTKRLSVARSER